MTRKSTGHESSPRVIDASADDKRNALNADLAPCHITDLVFGKNESLMYLPHYKRVS
jgi:hypothetical protein